MNASEQAVAEWTAAIERQGDALQRILVALAAMAGLLHAAGFFLPRDFHRALIRPLRAAEDAAERVTLSAAGRDQREAARLVRRFMALIRVLKRLAARALGFDCVREPEGDAEAPRADFLSIGVARERPDTS